jgi:hypothetical protein
MVTTGILASTASCNRRRHGVDFVRADDDAVDAARDRGFDVRGLLGRADLAVADDDLGPSFSPSALI